MKINSKQSKILINARKSKRISQEKMSYELEIAQTIYSKMERGLYNIKDWQLIKIEKLLNIKFK